MITESRLINNRISDSEDMSYKAKLINHIISELEQIHATALNAAKHAHAMATDKQNISENKYDTLGLESGYLAPSSGGTKFEFEGRKIMVISASSPLGKQLLGKELGDEYHIGQGSHSKHYCITDII